MTPSFLAGVLFSWSLAQVAVGMFFLMAYALGRHEGEYLLFGLLCLALAVSTLGIARGTFAGTPEEWMRATRVAHLGAIPALSFNVHFGIRYANVASARRLVAPIYALALAFFVAQLAGRWWLPGTVQIWDAEVLGQHYHFGTADPTPLAIAFYVTAAIELVATLIFLLVALRRGKREAMIAWFGGLLVCVAGVHDILQVLGAKPSMVFLLPHTFMLYAFAVASTLVIRYRLTAGELAQAETSLRLAAEELRHSQSELREVQGELVTKREFAAVGELAAAIAHEVRNPLAVISNATASLKRPALGDVDRQMLLGIVDEETARLNQLVTDLLRFARPAKIQASAVELSELVAAARRPAACRDHEVSVEVEPDAPAQVFGDAALLRAALENLVENACQATPPGGAIRVSVAPAEIDGAPAARIEVKDSGSGMPATVLERARDPFYTTRPSGTGLGLPIVERIANAHAGRLVLSSRPGAGTSAALLLPLGVAPAQRPAEPKSVQAERPS